MSVIPPDDEHGPHELSGHGDNYYHLAINLLAMMEEKAEETSLQLQPEHITQALNNDDSAHRREHEYKMFVAKAAAWVVAAVLVFVLILCAVFLAYNRPEYIAAVISAVMGFAGGFGLGKSTAKKESPSEE